MLALEHRQQVHDVPCFSVVDNGKLLLDGFNDVRRRGCIEIERGANR